MERHPVELEIYHRYLELSVAVVCYGWPLRAVIDTSAQLTTVSAEVGQELRRRGAPVTHGEYELHSHTFPIVAEIHQPIITQYTLEVEYTCQDRQFKNFFCVVESQTTACIVFGMDAITTIGYRILLHRRSPAAQRRRQERRRLARRELNRIRWRLQDEGINDLSESEAMSSSNSD